MTERRCSRLLVPALFLLVLGAGNILVGTFKVRQYDEVYSELATLEPAAEPLPGSALMRIHTMRRVTDRLERRRYEVEDRRNLYLLVVFGGKIFIALSTVLLLVAAIGQVLLSGGSRLAAQKTAPRPAPQDPAACHL